MADIILTCAKCKAQMKISEYLSEKQIPCASCGEPIAVPERKKAAGGLKLRKIAPPPPPPPAPENAVPEEPKATVITASIKQRPTGKKGRKDRKKTGIVATVASWIIFLVLAAALGYFRYVGSIPGISREAFIQYGLIAVAVCYLGVIILALKDNMFDGLLCIVVPLYPFYYILMVSNLVYVRAVVAAVLAAFGYDMALLLQEWWNHVFDSVNHWMKNA